MEESATDEAVGMQRGYAQIRSLVNRHQGLWAGRERRARKAVFSCMVNIQPLNTSDK